MTHYFSPLRILEPALPDYCEPANAFLHQFSATFRSCVPTNQALLSSLLGTCSIVAWLFAQLPQIYKNHRLKSTSGLSIFFLAEWLLGDLGNLFGSLFTHQALWQVIIASYYVTVDCALVAQWVWYEKLKHGRPLRSIWSLDGPSDERGAGGMEEVWAAVSAAPTGDSKHTQSNAHYTPRRTNTMDAFRIPNFGRIQNSPDSSSSNTPPSRTVHRISNSPMPSPKTMLYISMVLAVLSNSVSATPVSPFAPSPYHLASRTLAHATSTSSAPSAFETAGKIFSWMSTLLYLVSRLPQLYKNHVRRSTAGLSPTLFAAAFFGNLFYSTSLLTNPCAWNTFAPGEGRGWVGPDGSHRSDWVLRALPFFLGAAGVLVMDAAVGLQFVYFGDGLSRNATVESDDDEVLMVVDEGGIRKRIHRRWRRASGWIRGWVPSVSVAGTPSVSRAETPVQTPRSESPVPGNGGRSGPRSIRGGALEEARALLGTSSSPGRSYGSFR